MFVEVSGKDDQRIERRRWFTSSRADLYLWQNASGDIESFEYCYRNEFGEKSVRWHYDSGFEFADIDDGEATPLKNNTPICIANNSPDWGYLLRLFYKESSTADAEPFQFVFYKLLTEVFGS